MTKDLVAQVAAEDADVLVNPATGEIISAADIPHVVDFLAQIRDHAKLVQEARKHAEQILAEHARQVGAKTFEVDGRKVEVRDGDKTEYDPDILEQLLELGLPEERWNALVRQEVSYKVDGRVAKQIASANEAYGEVVRNAARTTPGNLYVKVTQ